VGEWERGGGGEFATDSLILMIEIPDY